MVMPPHAAYVLSDAWINWHDDHGSYETMPPKFAVPEDTQ